MNRINDKNIRLIKDTHTYVLDNEPEVKFESVTTVISRYLGAFDEMEVSEKCAYKGNYRNQSAADIRKEWSLIREHGTKVHEEIEEYILSGKTPCEDKSVIGIDWLKKYKMKYPMQIQPEVILYSRELGIAGTIDVMSRNMQTDEYELIDWKTGKVDFIGYNNKMGSHPLTEDLSDCKAEKFYLQLSMYRYILEEYYGLKVTNQIIAHITNVECKGYVAQYKKEHIKNIIKDLKRREICHI